MTPDELIRLSRREERASRRKRRPQPRIVDLATEPRPFVNLRVAADALGMCTPAVLARIERGDIAASCDGKIWRVSVASLRAYVARLAMAS